MLIDFKFKLHPKRYKDDTRQLVLEYTLHIEGKLVKNRQNILRIKPEQFDKKVERVINHPHQLQINDIINQARLEVEASLLKDRQSSIVSIIASQTPSQSNQTMLLAYGREYVKRCRLKDQLHTAEKYTSHLTKLSEYLGKLPTGMPIDIALDEVTEEWILKWSHWLKNNGTKSALTLHRRMGFISTLFIDARKRGLTKADPMAFLVFKEPKVLKSKLDLIQLRQLEQAEFPSGDKNRLINARNTFMLQFFAHGSRISDALTWKKENISRRQDGVYLTYSSRKTDFPMTIRLNAHAVALVDHYLATVPGPFLLPWLAEFIDRPNLSSNTNEKRLQDQISSKTSLINESLKKIERMLGLGVRLTTHVARHTFASLADRAIADPRAVSSALGHTNFSTTEIYLADLKADQINDIIVKLWKKGKWL